VRGGLSIAAVGGIVVLAFVPARNYVRHPWALFIAEPNYRERVEYRITRWMEENLPESRALATGSVRLWYNAWFNLPQVGGGSDQGLMNRNVSSAQWEIWLAEKPEPSVQWLRALGADVIMVHDETSQVIYHDMHYPRKFVGVLPVLYDDKQGNVIYRVQRRYPGLARVVETQVARGLGPSRSNYDSERIGAYAEALENGPDSPAPTRWVGSDEVRIQARLNAGESVVLQVTYDPAWRAYSGRERLAIEKDAMGFMRIEAPPGAHEIRVVFETPLENRIGRVVSALSGIVVVVLLGWGWRRRRETAAAA